MSASSDERLIERMADGDRAAFVTLYDRHAPRLFGLLVSLMRDRASAEDVLQDALIEVWKRAGQFDRTRASGIGWMALIARSRAYDQLRKRPRATESGDIPEMPVNDDPTPRLEAKESAEAARQALQTLPEEQRAAIMHAYYGGLTHEAIAQRTGLPVGTVKTRIRLGMRRLRDAMIVEDRAQSR